MATIIKRKKAYSVVYNYVDENGETKQKWETLHTHKEALFRNFCTTLLPPMAKESGAFRCMMGSFP